jgi:hypothetical protein
MMILIEDLINSPNILLPFLTGKIQILLLILRNNHEVGYISKTAKQKNDQ